MLATMADVVFVIDESGSEEDAFTHEWVRALVTGDVNNNDVLDSGEKSLATKLADEGIDDVRYGLVGFGENLNNQTPRFAHSQLFDIATGDSRSLFGDPTSTTSSGPDDPFVDMAELNTIFSTQPSGNLAQFGGEEDGWDALEHVVAEYDFRHGAVPIIVLVQDDEGRIDHVGDTIAAFTLAA
jgi:hypothetical protein